MATILVVDDELGIRALLTEILSDEGHTVEAAEDAAQARVLREKLQPDLVLLDIWMPDVDGITLLKEWNRCGQLTMPVIMMSGHGTIDTAVEAMKFGAAAFLEKPVTLQKLLRAVEEGLNRSTEVRPSGPGGGAGASAAFSGVELGAAHGGAAAAQPAAGAAVARAMTGAAAHGGHGAEAGGWSAGGAAAHATMPSDFEPQVASHGSAGLNNYQSFDLDRPLREARDAFEKSYFEYHLARENGSMTRVAEKTGLERTHLYRKLKHLGVDLSRTKRSSH